MTRTEKILELIETMPLPKWEKAGSVYAEGVNWGASEMKRLIIEQIEGMKK